MYLFKKVSTHCSEGVNFREHLYVPEVSERTGEPQHEREDHNHVLNSGKAIFQMWMSKHLLRLCMIPPLV